MTLVRLASWVALVASLGGLACSFAHTASRPDDVCAQTCEERISRCGATGCVRGCQLALDRLVEHESEPVLACVKASPAACDDWLWADCAARVGPHADGGPPPPAAGSRH